MKVAIHTNDKSLSLNVSKRIIELCHSYHIDIVDNQPDVVISIGGDGTLLSAFHRFKQQLSTVKFVAIHTGNLGFYTDFLSSQVDELMKLLQTDSYHTITYPLLDIQMETAQQITTYQALNEYTIKTISGTLVCDVFIGDTLFEVFRGDGLCLSTPTGSTAISKSLGGAILHPQLDAMQLVEIAPLNNRVYRTVGSPLILPKDDTVTLKIKRAITPVVTIDNLEPTFLDCSDIITIHIKLSQERIAFLDLKHIPFWSRVENAFIGEINREALNVTPSTRRYYFVKKNNQNGKGV